jgi:hypothetical protein
MKLSMSFWRNNMSVFEAQARELRALSARWVTSASEPIRDPLRRFRTATAGHSIFAPLT